MPENASSWRSRFFSLPSTSTGRISAISLLVLLALIAANVVFFNAPNEIGPPWLKDIVGVAIGVSMLIGLVAGVVALVSKRERSWAVWLSTAVPVAIVLFEVVEVLVPGE